jgi:hypothetical protein
MNRRLKKGQHGWITQEILDFVYLNGEVSYKEMDTHYLMVCQGKPAYQRSSSFNHHLVNLTKPSTKPVSYTHLTLPTTKRSCRSFLIKGTNGKYTVGYAFSSTDLYK